METRSSFAGCLSCSLEYVFVFFFVFLKETLLFYKIASVLCRISLDERNFFSEFRETFDVIFILY